MSVGSNPAFPNIIPYDHNAYVVNHVNITLSRKILKSDIIFSKKTIKLVKVLHSIGVIKNYIITKDIKVRRIVFTIFFYRNTSYYHSVRLISTQSKKFFITLKALVRLKYATRNSIYLLSTSYGVITHSEAIKKKIGGILLCAIN